MKQLYIYAYPAQMITIQLQENDKILLNENCSFSDIIFKIKWFIKNNNDIQTIVIVGGQSNYSERIEQLIKFNFNGQINIERIND